MTQEMSEHSISLNVVHDRDDIVDGNASQIWKSQVVVKKRSASED